MEQLNRYTKLSYRVVFPFELRLFNTVSNKFLWPLIVSPYSICLIPFMKLDIFTFFTCWDLFHIFDRYAPQAP